MLHGCYSIIQPSYQAVTLRGHHPLGTRTDVQACDISRACARERLRERSCVCAQVMLLPISFLSLEGQDVTTCFPKQSRAAWSSWHLSVLNWCVSLLVNENHNLPDAVAEHFPGSHHKAVWPGRLLLTERFSWIFIFENIKLFSVNKMFIWNL